MILQLPAYDLAIVNARSVAAAEHTRTGEALGRAEMAAAAHLIRKLWGDAARLLVAKDVDDDDHTDVDALVLFDQDGALLWFDWTTEAFDYPGAQALSDDRGRPLTQMSHQLVAVIEAHLQDAYDAMQGVDGALGVADDDHFSPDKNVLVLDISAALAA